MPDSARPINELTGIKKPSSVLVRGFSALEIAKQAGMIPAYYTEEQFIESLRGPAGFSNYDLWTQIPGNEDKTIDDYWVFLGLNEAIAAGLALDQLAIDVVQLAIASAAVENAAAALALASAVDTSGLAPKASPIFTGLLSSSERTALTGRITGAIAGHTDDWAPASLAISSVIRADPSAAWELRGLTGGSNGRVIILQNVSAFDLMLKSEAGTSTAANRFLIEQDVRVRPNMQVILVYDSVSSRWRMSGGRSFKATVAQIIAGNDDEFFPTSKGLADAGAFVVAGAGEIAGSTWTPDMSLGINRSWTLTGNRILASPTGMKDGLTYTWKFKQDATGGRTLTLPAAGIQFNFGAAGVWAPNTAANKVNYLSGIYDATESRVVVTGHVSA